MQDGGAVGIVDRADSRNQGPVVEQQRPLVAALSPALRVKDRAIERNSAWFGRQHGCFRLGLICVLAKQSLRHCTNTLGAFPLASSQSGTGRFFERRKSGLKSLEA